MFFNVLNNKIKIIKKGLNPNVRQKNLGKRDKIKLIDGIKRRVKIKANLGYCCILR